MLLKITSDHKIKSTKLHLQYFLQWGFVLLLIICAGTLKAQIRFGTLQQRMKAEQKFIIMNVSTRSCVYCLMQEKKIQKHKAVKSRLNSEVYYLSWMVEETAGFTFNGNQFNSGTAFIDQYGKDENGFVAYPLWLIFDKGYKVLYRYFGVISPEKIGEILDIIKD